MELWRGLFTQAQARLAASNKRFGSKVIIGYVQFDVESWSWSPSYIGKPGTGPGTQAVIDAIRTKDELIFNVTKELLPSATISYLDFGTSYWLPTGSTDGCFNLHGCSIRGKGPGNANGGSCDDGFCMDLTHDNQNSSFLSDPAFAGFAVSLYEPWESRLMQQKFARTAANAKVVCLPSSLQNVVPTVTLGGSYQRNMSKEPDISFQGRQTRPVFGAYRTVLRDAPFFHTGELCMYVCTQRIA